MKGGGKLRNVGVPAFYVPGLATTRGNKGVRPLFLSHEDLNTAYARLRESDPDAPEKPAVEVVNLLDTIATFSLGENGNGGVLPGELAEWGFVPSSEALAYAKQAGRRGTGRSRPPRIKSRGE